jgi:hypothetical protein
MPDPAPLLFALAAGTMSASYAILLRLSAGSINPAIGAIVFAILRVSQRRVRPSLDCWPTHARPTRPTPQSSTRVCRAPSPASRPSTLGAVGLARFLVRHRANRRGDGPPGLRPSAHPVRRPRLASDLLHGRDGALADERDGHPMGANAVARDAAGGVRRWRRYEALGQ